MRRSRATAVVVATVALATVLPQGGAMARDAPNPPQVPGAIKGVQELDFVFIPDPVTAKLGQTVRWWNPMFNSHTSTQYAPLSLWDSGDMPPGATFDYTFTAAGQYPYLCTLHERYDMVSSVGVRDVASPPNGPVGTIFTITVATVPAPTDYVYDIQKREPGGGWLDWMPGVTSTSVQFDSTGKLPGTYAFRSRLHRVSDDASSDYSPRVPVSVTP